MGAKSTKVKNNEEGVDDEFEDGDSNISESERRVNALLGTSAPSEEEGVAHEREGVYRLILPLFIIVCILYIIDYYIFPMPLLSFCKLY